MAKTFVIRQIEKRDREGLISNLYSYLDEIKMDPNLGLMSYEKRPKLTQQREWFQKMYKEVLGGEAVALVAVVNGKIVGLCDISRQGKAVEIKHVGVLEIAVLKEYRGIGIGSALMKNAIKRSKKKFEIIQLSLFAINKMASKFYERLGFVDFGTVPKGIKRNGKYIGHKYMYLDQTKRG